MILNLLKSIKRKKEVKDWEKRGKTPPTPQLIKQEAVMGYAEHYNIDTLIETGTYTGDMVEAVKDTFNNIYSIELSEKLYWKCRKRFEFRKSSFPSINLFCGDSSKELPKILAIPRMLKSRRLFWLDAHYSGGETARGDLETPIVEELKIILNDNPKHIILIDDARCFNGKNDYPKIEFVKQYVSKFGKKMDIIDDIIRIV